MVTVFSKQADKVTGPTALWGRNHHQLQRNQSIKRETKKHNFRGTTIELLKSFLWVRYIMPSGGGR